MRGLRWLVLLPGSRRYRPAGRPAEKMAVAGSGWGLAQLAEALGSSEQALRLIVSILMGKGAAVRGDWSGTPGKTPRSPWARATPRRRAALREAGARQRLNGAEPHLCQRRRARPRVCAEPAGERPATAGLASAWASPTGGGWVGAGDSRSPGAEGQCAVRRAAGLRGRGTPGRGAGGLPVRGVQLASSRG